MLWVDENRGYLTDWLTQQWVRVTGRPVDLNAQSWLAGPVGDTKRIGAEFFLKLAQEQGLKTRTGSSGIVPDLTLFDGEGFDSAQVSPLVRHFYEHTAAYEMDAWSQWNGLFRPFGGLLAVIFSRRLQQLNARYVRPLRESIHVYAGQQGETRADHVLTLWGKTFLRLHYRFKAREFSSKSFRTEE